MKFYNSFRFFQYKVMLVYNLFQYLLRFINIIAITDTEDQIYPALRNACNICNNITPNLMIGNNDKLVIRCS